MNRTMLNDRIWKLYFFLPHCVYNIKKNRSKANDRFDRVKNENISIIATNCVGGEIYSILKMKFCSPFINTSMSRKDFIQMCSNLRSYMNSKFEPYKIGGCRARGGAGRF